MCAPAAFLVGLAALCSVMGTLRLIALSPLAVNCQSLGFTGSPRVVEASITAAAPRIEDAGRFADFWDYRSLICAWTTKSVIDTYTFVTSTIKFVTENGVIF